jgi:hypothetical protein
MAGRKRKFDPTIPKHIDQAGIPAGIYWDGRWGGTWYVLERSPEGKQKWRSVAPATALLSDLHVIAEARAGKTDRNVLRALCDAPITSTAAVSSWTSRRSSGSRSAT